jgi:hypothetical protein
MDDDHGAATMATVAIDSVAPVVEGGRLGVQWVTAEVEMGDMEVAMGIGARGSAAFERRPLSKPLPASISARRARTGAVMFLASSAAKIKGFAASEGPLYVDLYVGGLREDAWRCHSDPFRLERAADGQLRIVQLSDTDQQRMVREQEEIGRKEHEESLVAQQEVERLKELERAVPMDCALCLAGATDELGQLLAFRSADNQTWHAHRHCVEWCQTVMDADPQARGKRKKVAEHEMVALKYLKGKKYITPGQMIKDCWRNKCTICGQKGAHLHCHNEACDKIFHLKCAGADLGVAVCREETVELESDEEIGGYKMGHGRTDTFCGEHSHGRLALEFKPVAVRTEAEGVAMATSKAQQKRRPPIQWSDSDSSLSSSSEDEEDDEELSEWLPGAKKRKWPAARSSPADRPAAAAGTRVEGSAAASDGAVADLPEAAIMPVKKKMMRRMRSWQTSPPLPSSTMCSGGISTKWLTGNDLRAPPMLRAIIVPRLPPQVEGPAVTLATTLVEQGIMNRG